MQNLSRERVKYYIVTEDNWFIKEQNYVIEKVCQIDDALSYYALYDAVKVYGMCKKINIDCKIIKYNIAYTPIKEEIVTE